MNLAKIRARTSERTVGGEKMPIANRTSVGLRNAMKEGGDRFAGESGEVLPSGKPTTPRLDRRARAWGGRVKEKASSKPVEDDRDMDEEVSPPGKKDGGKTWNPGGSKGKLHRELNISEDKKIPAKRLSKAEHSKDPEIKRDAIRAETMKHWKHR